jgi:hypothetical protein
MTDRLAELKKGALAPQDIEIDVEANRGKQKKIKCFLVFSPFCWMS